MRNYLKLLLLSFLMIFVNEVHSQKIFLSQQDTIQSNEEGTVAVKVDGSWKQMPTTTMSERFNLFRTDYRNVSGVDSTAVLHGLKLSESSTEISNGLDIEGNTIIEDGYFSFKTGRDNDESFYLIKDQNNGIKISGVTTPVINSNTANIMFQAAGIFGSGDADIAQPVPVTKALQQFQTIGNVDNVNWQNYKIVNLPLFSFYQYGHNTQITGYNDSVKVHQTFSVVNNSATATYFKASSEKIESNKVFEANAGIKLAELSYTPSSSTDIQAEALTATLGTKWSLTDGLTHYEVKKVEIGGVVKLVRTIFSEF